MVLGIVGLGLMGGSLSLSLKHKRFFSLHIGHTRSEENAKEALSLGIVDEIRPLSELISLSDVIVLAVPVGAIIDMMPELLGAKKTALIVDLGSTKSLIREAIPQALRKNFVLAHPMCGTEFSGPKAAFRDLYRNSICVLCNTEENSAPIVDLCERIFLMMDMDLHKMDAKEHDYHASLISHLPHMLSFALANTVLEQENTKNILTLAGGGFKDMSRLAKSAPSMWSPVFNQNKKELLRSLDVFEKQLQMAKDMIKNDEYEKLSQWMKKANKLHQIFK